MGTQVQRGGEFLSPAHTFQCQDSAGSQPPGVNQPPRQAPHRHAPPRPGRQCARSTKSGHPPPAPRPGHFEARLCAPFCRRILETPRLAGRWNLDTMDPTCALGLLLLPLLITGTALGNAVQDLPGIAPRRNPHPRFSPGFLPLRQLGRPAPAVSLPTFRRRPPPPVGRGSCAPVCTFSLSGGPSALKQRGQNSLGKPNPPSPGMWLTPLRLSVGNNAESCLLPPDVGPCRARIPSFYYDRYTQSCRQFMYGGCEGNANNFETLEACDEACGWIESKLSQHTQKIPDHSLHRRAGSNLANFPGPIFQSKFEPEFSQILSTGHWFSVS